MKSIYSPDLSKYKPKVDIVAVNGYSGDADSTWVFLPKPQSPKTTPGRKDGPHLMMEQMLKGGFDNIEDSVSIVKEILTPATKQLPVQTQQSPGKARLSQQTMRATHQQEENRAEPSDARPSNLSSVIESRELAPSLRAQAKSSHVNWLRDNNMLPGSFPSARIIQFSFQFPSGKSTIKVVASKLAQELSNEREGCGAGLSRPIIFIANGPGINVVGEALIMKERAHLAEATVGLVFLGPASGGVFPPEGLLKVAADKSIPITCFFGNDYEGINPLPTQSDYNKTEKLRCTHSNLGRFSSSEDPSYLRMKATIKADIDFATTRRLWDAISANDATEVKRQILKGAVANRKNPKGQNALHLATMAGKLEYVKLLLDNNVEVNAKDNEGNTSIILALREGNDEIVSALLKRGALAAPEDIEAAIAKYDSKDTSKRFEKLFDSEANARGLRVHRKKDKQLQVDEDCQLATSMFNATVVTFEIRCEGDPKTSRDEKDEEYHVVETLPLSTLLYGDAIKGLNNDNLSSKKLRWFHLPANNMDWVEALFFQLKVGNEDGRLSGEEHRGQFPHSLFLQPQANVLDQGQDGHKATVLFMPYLHFETNEGRARLRNAVKQATNRPLKTEDDSTSASAESSSGSSARSSTTDDHNDNESGAESNEDRTRKKVDFKEKFERFKTKIREYQDGIGEGRSDSDRLISAYLARGAHYLHLRRTLDQFYYIGVEDTEDRDINQVVQRYAVKKFSMTDESRMRSKLIMVDQLWLWVLEDKHMVITSFPQSWGGSGSSGDSESGLLEQIKGYLHLPNRQLIMSVNQLASVIITECTRVFGRFKIPHRELRFLDFFDASISDVADRHAKICDRLYSIGWDDEKDLKAVQKTKNNDVKKEKQKTLHIAEEIELLVEIQDIRDELNIIKTVLDEQSSVLTIPHDEGGYGSRKSKENISLDTFPRVDGKTAGYYANVNRKTIERMISRATEVYSAVYHLIDLKQKQANIAEARYARKEASSAAKEGRTVLALTIVNMIFLPLSFLASFFALDIDEFPKDPETGQSLLHLSWVSQYIFGISLAIAIPSIALAMAIGPMAGFTKKVGRTLGSWGVKVLLIFIALIFGIPGIIVYSVYYLYKRTPYYGRDNSRKRVQCLDPEVAVESVESESQSTGKN
ncbi:hypothetical protein HD806DRAFT_540551 [Xylariaceae sp. AK1471]|nr:hypothetical protein HD806DRAFT_540551 [Xylariaceae sp. AK1471]